MTSRAKPPHAASNPSAPLIIAIDGPSAGGKGTLAKKLSEHYKLPHLDTGLTYRFVARTMLQRHISLDDESAAVKIARNLQFDAMDKAVLSDDSVGSAASKIAVMPKLRQALVAKQRRFAASGRGAVLDGRDIATVVCPHAQIKLFVTADSKIRAQRRWEELRARGQKVDYDTVFADMQARDLRDSSRDNNPLRQDANALLIDTTKLSIEEAFYIACKLADTVIGV